MWRAGVVIKGDQKTTTARESSQAAAGGLLGLDWRPSRFRECQWPGGTLPLGLALGLRHPKNGHEVYGLRPLASAYGYS